MQQLGKLGRKLVHLTMYNARLQTNNTNTINNSNNSTTPSSPISPPLSPLEAFQQETLLESLKYIGIHCHALTSLEFVETDMNDVLKNMSSELLQKNLKHISIRYCNQMTHENILKPLHAYSQLRSITLFNASSSSPGPFTDAGMKELIQDKETTMFTNLQKFSLLGHSFVANNCSDYALQSLAKHCPKVTHFEMNLWTFKQQTQDQQAQQQALPAPAANAPLLPYVPPMPVLSEKGVIALNQLTLLQELRIHECDKIAQDADWVLLCSKLSQLRVLAMTNCKISDKALSQIFTTNTSLAQSLEELVSKNWQFSSINSASNTVIIL